VRDLIEKCLTAIQNSALHLWTSSATRSSSQTTTPEFRRRETHPRRGVPLRESVGMMSLVSIAAETPSAEGFLLS
jgi:hypothetical protein